MFFGQTIDWKREVAVNLLGNGGYGREKFLEERYSLSRSEFWDVRQRILAALEPLPSGHPRHLLGEDSTGPCAACQEKEARIQALVAGHAAERERGSRRLTIQAAVIPCSTDSIVLLQKAAFSESPSAETLRTRIAAAAERAVGVMESLPWAEKIRQLAADELFAGNTPILGCVEPRSMAVPVLQRGPDRTGETWKKVLDKFPNLTEVASDEGKGILAAVLARGLQSVGEPFHALVELSKCLAKLESEAYRRIADEYEAGKVLEDRQNLKRSVKRATQHYRKARKVAAKAIDRFDRVRRARPLLRNAIEPFDGEGKWLSFAKSAEMIREGIAILRDVEAPHRKRVANAFNPDRILTFKAIIEAPVDFDGSLPSCLSVEDYIGVAIAAKRPSPAEPLAAVRWGILRALDGALARECPTWTRHRVRIQDAVENLFRGSSWAESINSRIRVDQQVLKHLGNKFLALLALAHNATPFRGGKRRGRSPLEILGISLPAPTWLDCVLPTE